MKTKRRIIAAGAGGMTPRLFQYDPESQQAEYIVSFPERHTIAAIDIDQDNEKIAVGAGTGMIEIVSQDHDFEKPSITSIFHGAPLLSICWTGHDILAASDAAGRCLLWNIHQKNAPWKLDTDGNIVFSLAYRDDGILSGITSEGNLLSWRLMDGWLADVQSNSAPPPVGSLVHLRYWPEKNALVYPGKCGHLVCHFLNDKSWKIIKAHTGELYAFSILGESVYTVGFNDGLMKIWDARWTSKTAAYPVQENVTCLEAVQRHGLHLFMIDKDGAFNHYRIDDDCRLVSRFTDFHCRSIAVSREESIPNQDETQSGEVYELIEKITHHIEYYPYEDITPLHARLTEMGYEHVSLEILISSALDRRQAIEAFRHSAALMQILPLDNPDALPAVQRHVKLLERFWHLEEAVSCCMAYQESHGMPLLPDGMDKLSEKAELISSQNCMIEPGDVSIEEMERVIESADILGKKINGRFVIRVLEEERCFHGGISSELIRSKCEQVLRESESMKIPFAHVEHVCRLTSDETENVECLSFSINDETKLKGLQVIFKVISEELDTIVIPAIVLDWRTADGYGSFQESNRAALNALTAIRNKAVSFPYIDRIRKNMKEALRRIVTEKKAEFVQ